MCIIIAGDAYFPRAPDHTSVFLFFPELSNECLRVYVLRVCTYDLGTLSTLLFYKYNVFLCMFYCFKLYRNLKFYGIYLKSKNTNTLHMLLKEFKRKRNLKFHRM